MIGRPILTPRDWRDAEYDGQSVAFLCDVHPQLMETQLIGTHARLLFPDVAPTAQRLGNAQSDDQISEGDPMLLQSLGFS